MNWDKAQELVRLLEVVTPEARRGVLAVLLKAEGYRLPRAVPSSQLFDLYKLVKFIRLYAVKIK